MFATTDMCGKRLKDWKTIPIPRRTSFTSTRAAVISSPRTTIRPLSIGSSRFTQRRSVDLPGARRADEADDLVLGEREVDPAQHLELSEALVDALEDECGRLRAHGIPPASWRRRSRAMSQSVNRVSGMVIRRKRIAVQMYGV